MEDILTGRITPESNLQQLLNDYPALVPLLVRKRLACAGCGMSKFETLGEMACNYHLEITVLVAEMERAIAGMKNPRLSDRQP